MKRFFKFLGRRVLLPLLLILIGAKHPPTANDNAPLGPVRPVLGWLMLLFVPFLNWRLGAVIWMCAFLVYIIQLALGSRGKREG